MHCPRIGHYARLNSNGTIGCCGHMVNPQQFPTFRAMETVLGKNVYAIK